MSRHPVAQRSRQRHVVSRWSTLALLLALALAVGCGNVESLIAQGDELRAQGRHAEAQQYYWQAYHIDHDHPLVVQRIGQVKHRPGGTSD